MERVPSEMMQRGSKAWFDHQYEETTRTGVDGFASSIRGSQHVRLDQIAGFLKQVGSCSRLLDIGCGTGALMSRLHRHPFAQVAGTDISGIGLQQAARRLPKNHFVQSALPHLPFADNSFDGILCLEVLYYLDDHTRQAAIVEMKRVLTPGGWLCLSSRLDDGTRYLAPETLLVLAENLGLEPLGKFWHRAFLYRPWERLLLGGWRQCRYLENITLRILDGELDESAWQTWKWRLVGITSRTPGLTWLPDAFLGLVRLSGKGVVALLGMKWPVRLAWLLGEILLPNASRTGQVILLRNPPKLVNVNGRGMP